MLAAIGLLALPACVHDGGEDDTSPTTTEMDDFAETFDDLLGANLSEFLDETAQAEISLPEFEPGGVVQSATVNVADVSGVSTSFDGSHLTIAVSRADGSTLSLNSRSDALSDPDSDDLPIAGDGAQGWVLSKVDNEGMSTAFVTVTTNDSDAANYLTMGYWGHIDLDTTEPDFIRVEIGVFVDGPELSHSSPASLPAQGTASYYGPAWGAYTVLHGRDTGVTPGSTESGVFNSTVELTTDFAANSISGCVGCRDGVTLFGTLDDAGTGESTQVMFEDSGYWLHLDPVDLDPTNLGSDGTFSGQKMRLEHSAISIESTEGAWGGRFSNIADSAGDPRLVAGTFGAEATSAGMSEGAFLGSFVGTKE